MIVGTVAALCYVITHPVEEYLTEFYILSTEGKAEGYPEVLAVGEEERVILGVVNQEQESMSYKIEIMIGETLVEEIGPITLTHEEKWEEEVGFLMQEPDDNQKVEFKLFKLRALGQKGETLLGLWLGRGDLSATITNQGQNEAEYEITVKVKARIEEEEDEMEETKMYPIGPETLNPGSSWEREIKYLYPKANWQNAEFFLYKDGKLIYTEDTLGGYPALHLWIEVRENNK